MSETNFEFFLSALKTAQGKGQDLVVVTLVHVVGSSPQEVGAKMIVSPQGLEYGTVGGGKVEMRAIHEAQTLLKSVGAEPQFRQWNLQTDIGMTCGGVVHFFFEVLKQERPWTVAVFGAGHIAQSLIPLLGQLSCRVICVDPRLDWLNRLPEQVALKKIHTDNMQAVVDELPDQSFLVISTMGHAFDFPILFRAMQQRDRFRYVGNIGSDLKAKRLRQDLLEAGIASSRLQDFFCPVGENFGQNLPVEIAFSIIAQILRVRDQ